MLLVMALLFSAMLVACEPAEKYDGPIYEINDNEDNKINIDHTTKQQAIDKVVDALENMQERIGSADVGEGGYYLGLDFHINTENRSNFVFKLRAHLFTYPYEDEFGNIDQDALAKHNQLIKKSTLLIEWYDGVTNSMLIGFYFDGIKSNPNDPGNILYLNLQGQKRWFKDFGDTVMYQQIIRLITKFDLNRMLNNSGVGGAQGTSAIRTLLDMAITNNYKLVINKNEETKKEVTSVLYSSVNLDVIRGDISEIIRNIFSAYQDKLDPLTSKYLGFKFSILGQTQIQTLTTDALFFVEPDTDGLEDLLTSATLNLSGSSLISGTSTPFTADIGFVYGAAPPAPIELDKLYYKYYDWGKYEFTGNLYLPTMNLKMDALIRTKLNNYDNPSNIVFSEFRDIANGDLLIGAYYKNELAYFDIEGLSHLYGGVHLEDIGFPKVFIEGWDVSKLMLGLKRFYEDSVTKLVDNLLTPKEDSAANNLKEVIMRKMEATFKIPGDPTSKNTEKIRIDHELIKDVLREGGYGDYSTRDIINIVNAQLPITLDEIATILGITSAEILIEKIWFLVTFDVDTNEIRFQVYSDIGLAAGEQSVLLLQLDLVPVKVGEDMMIADIRFDNFKPLQPIYTYSANMQGQFLFALNEVVDFSDLLSSFMDDVSGLNTKYILPLGTKLDFTLAYDQYIREQQLQTEPGGDRDGRWTRSSRNAFILNVFVKGKTEEENITLFNIYANDVSFKSTVDGESEEERLERLGYIWIDFVCLQYDNNPQDIPKFKIREDYWLQSVNRYMNQTEAGENVGTMLNPDVSLSITTIISALMEDSYIQFQPEQIEITTSNETVQNIFNVEQLIGNIAADIGLKQRVFGLDDIEDDFAHYTVGEFQDITAQGPYTTKLHETIDVTFNFRQYDRSKIKVTSDIKSWEDYKKLEQQYIILTREWDEVVPMKFEYEAESIKVRDEASEYYPLINGPIYESETSPLIHRFMGAQRGYKITMTGSTNDRKLITSLANSDWTYLDLDKTKSQYIVLDEELESYRTTALQTDLDLLELLLQDKYNEYMNKARLLPHYRLEPLEEKPAKLDVNAGLTSPAIVSYASNIILDWSKVTIDGGEYLTEVVIAEGMMGETHFPVHIVVTNRRIDTTDSNGNPRLPAYVNVIDKADSAERVKAPVVDEIFINAYDYIWQKAVYLENNFNKRVFNSEAERHAAYIQANLDFVSYYFGQYIVEVRFVDPDPEVQNFLDTPVYQISSKVTPGKNSGYLAWSFDKNKNEQVYDETDISFSSSETYVHTNFKGRVIALKVIVEARTIIGVRFEGETELNVYTVDVLDESTHTIPLYPAIVFAQKDPVTDKNIEMFLIDSVNEVFSPMQWLYPKADNLHILGTNTPFQGTDDNITSTYVDLYRSLGVGEWLFAEMSPIVTVEVLCPAKEVIPLGVWDELNYVPTVIENVYERVNLTPDGEADWGSSPTTTMVPSYARMTVYADKAQQNPMKYTGTYYIDPFDANTAILPTSIEVWFYGRDNDPRNGYSKVYSNRAGFEETVKWKIDEGEGALVQKDAQGRYTLTVNSNTERSLKLIVLVGNTTVGYIEVNICVKILSSTFSSIEFFSQDGTSIPTLAENDEFTMTASTYRGFMLPAYYEVTFGDDDVRTYTAAWKGKSPSGLYNMDLANVVFSPGRDIDLMTVMEGKSGVTLEVKLKIRLLNEELENIYFTDIPAYYNGIELKKLNINFIRGTNVLEIYDVPLDAQGKIPNLYFGRFHYTSAQYAAAGVNPGNIDVSRDPAYFLTPMEFLTQIFGHSYLQFSDASRNFMKDLEIYNLEGILDVRELIKPMGSSVFTPSENYVIRLGYGRGAHDITVKIRFIDGLRPDSSDAVEQRIDLYDNFGNALWGIEGYVMGDNITVDLAAVNQTTAQGSTVYFHFGPDGVRLDKWYVEDSNVSSITRGSYVYSISSEILYGGNGVNLTLSTVTSQGFRIRRVFNVRRVQFNGAYQSVKTLSTDLFTISDGLITVQDLYAFYPLNYYLSNAQYIPKIIKRTVDDQVITITGVTWNINPAWHTYLSNYNYLGYSSPVLLATATILGWKEITQDAEGREVAIWHNRETISLYVVLESAEVLALPLENTLNLLTDFEDITVDRTASTPEERARVTELLNASFVTGSFSYREFIIYVDAYRNASYRGSFNPPENLTVQYYSGLIHTFSNLRYRYRGRYISAVPYGLSGISWLSDDSGRYILINNEKVYMLNGDGQYDITLTADLGAGQILAVRLHFYDKNVEYVRPVVAYDDIQVRNAILTSIGDSVTEMREQLNRSVNEIKMTYQLELVVQAILGARDSVDTIYLASEISKLFAGSIQEVAQRVESGMIREALTSLMAYRLTLFRASEIVPNTEVGDIRSAFNYGAALVNAEYDQRLSAAVSTIIDLMLAYVRNNEGASFDAVTAAVEDFYTLIYKNALYNAINGKITDFVLPVILDAAATLSEEESYFTIGMKNSIMAEISVANILSDIDSYKVKKLGGKADTNPDGLQNWIFESLDNEFERALDTVIRRSSYSTNYVAAVDGMIRARKLVVDNQNKATLDTYNYVMHVWGQLTDYQEEESRNAAAWTNISGAAPAFVTEIINEFNAEYGALPAAIAWTNFTAMLRNRIETHIPSVSNYGKKVVESYFDMIFSYQDTGFNVTAIAVKELINKNVGIYLGAIRDTVASGLALNTGARLSSALTYAVSYSVDGIISEARIIAAMKRAIKLNEAHYESTGETGVFIIDPYGEYISVPTKAEMVFSSENGGYSHIAVFEWTKPLGWTTQANPDAGVNYKGNKKSDVQTMEIAWAAITDEINNSAGSGSSYYILLSSTKNNITSRFYDTLFNSYTGYTQSQALKIWARLYYSTPSAGTDLTYSERLVKFEELVASYGDMTQAQRKAKFYEIDQAGLTEKEVEDILSIIASLRQAEGETYVLSIEARDILMTLITYGTHGADNRSALFNMVSAMNVSEELKARVYEISNTLARLNEFPTGGDAFITNLIRAMQYNESFNVETEVLQGMHYSKEALARYYARSVAVNQAGASNEKVIFDAFTLWHYNFLWKNLKIYIPDSNAAELWAEILMDLEHTEEASAWNIFTGSVGLEAVGAQAVSVIIKVKDRSLKNENFKVAGDLAPDGYDRETYTAGQEVRYIDAFYHVTDPFSARVKDFPSILSFDPTGMDLDPLYSYLSSYSALGISWDYTDVAISYRGNLSINPTTGLYGVLVQGYVKNKRVGQQVVLRLVVDQWEYNKTSGSGVKQYVGAGANSDVDNYLPGDGIVSPTNYVSNADAYNIMSPINFIFSRLVDYSLQDVYLITFRRTTYVRTGGVERTETGNINVLFYPENSKLLTASADEYEQAVVDLRKNYVFYWDNTAVNDARNSVGAVTGGFSLGNVHKTKIMENTVASYQFEETSIMNVNISGLSFDDLVEWYRDDLGMGEEDAQNAATLFLNQLYGITSVAVLPINPFDPALPSTAGAKGTIAQKSGQDLGEARVIWNKTLNVAIRDLSEYVLATYTTLSAADAEKSAMELLLNVNRSEVEQKNLLASIKAWYVKKWATANGVTIPANYDDAWDLMLTKSQGVPATLAKMRLLEAAIVSQNGNRGGSILNADYWTDLQSHYQYVRNSIIARTDSEKIQTIDGLFNTLPGVLANELRNMVQAYGNNDAAKIAAYNVYNGYDLWIKLKNRAESNNKMFSRLMEIENSAGSGFIFERYYAAWNAFEAILASANAEKHEGWIRMYNFVTVKSEIAVIGDAEKADLWDSLYAVSAGTEMEELATLLTNSKRLTPLTETAKVNAYDIFIKSEAWRLLTAPFALGTDERDTLENIFARYNLGGSLYAAYASAYDDTADAVAGSNLSQIFINIRTQYNSVALIMNNYLCYLEVRNEAIGTAFEGTLQAVEASAPGANIYEKYSYCWNQIKNTQQASGVYTLSDAYKVAEWEAHYQNASIEEKTALNTLLVEQENRTGATVRVKAIAYNTYMKAQKWDKLKAMYLGAVGMDALYEELSALENATTAATSYEIKEKCFDTLDLEFETETLAGLDALTARAIAANPLLTGNEITAKAWDMWLKGKAYNVWMEKKAKEYLCIEEEYDIYSKTDYLDGGIDGTRTVTLLLRLTDGGYVHVQTFRVRLLFLDMSPRAYWRADGSFGGISVIADSSGNHNAPTEVTVGAKVNYQLINDLSGKNDYTGRINPYDNNQSPLVQNALNCFAYLTLNNTQSRYDANGNMVEMEIITFTEIVWDIPANGKIRSKSFVYNGVRYESNMLTLNVTTV